jgi:hypothetical protein
MMPITIGFSRSVMDLRLSTWMPALTMPPAIRDAFDAIGLSLPVHSENDERASEELAARKEAMLRRAEKICARYAKETVVAECTVEQVAAVEIVAVEMIAEPAAPPPAVIEPKKIMAAPKKTSAKRVAAKSNVSKATKSKKIKKSQTKNACI